MCKSIILSYNFFSIFFQVEMSSWTEKRGQESFGSRILNMYNLGLSGYTSNFILLVIKNSWIQIKYIMNNNSSNL